MKTEEFILQELEKDRMKADAVENTAEDTSKSNIKFMIAGEAPVVVSRACELLIRELTCRAWQHTERNRRRTLQRQDIHAAVGESDVYDFLIDIVPRVTSSTSRSAQAASDVGMPHQHLAHGIPQPMDSAASLMGQTLGTDFMADPQQQFNYLMHMQQQQQQQHAGVVDQNDPSNLGVPQQPNQGWHDGGV
jgi:nuclear transcription factor Y gamma